MSLVKTLPLLLSLSAALGSVSAWALPNDNEQPIRIQANEAQLDDKQGIATYKGDVIITQGSMKITGNTVTITRNAAGEIDVAAQALQPRQRGQRANLGSWIIGQAHTQRTGAVDQGIDEAAVDGAMQEQA